MKNYSDLLKKIGIRPISYLKNKKTLIIKTNDKKYVLKEKINNPLIYEYLKNCSFNNYLYPLFCDNYEITEYLEETRITDEQKLEELIKIVALLHSKTTYYEKTNIAYNKEIYENLKNNIEYLESYYKDIITLIERNEIMSPSEYLFARNYTIISSSLYYVKEKLEKWYKKVEDETSIRMVILHNNLKLEHFIYNQKKALISWGKSKFGSPIFDLINIFNNYGNKYDFKEILKIYESIYPLKEEELDLLYIFMMMPPKFEFKGTEYDLCNDMSKKIELIYCANKIILPDKFKNGKKNH